MTDAALPAALTLHAVRLLGFADTEAVAARFGQNPTEVEDQLIQAGVRGWAARSSFVGTRGWSLTEAGRRENERLLAAELDRTGTRTAVEAAHAAFAPLNADVVAACSALQLQSLNLADGQDGPDGHGQPGAEALPEALSRGVAFAGSLELGLAAALPRFCGYAGRLEHALACAATEKAWYTATDRDSFHHAWFELHEDFIATLGLSRS